MNTTTTLKAPSPAALQWLRVNEHYFEALKNNAPLMKAAKEEYRQKFGRDLNRDIERMKRIEERRNP